MTKIRAWLTPAHRRWLYAIGTALLPILATLGWITDSQVASVGALLGAVLTGVATAHTNVPSDTVAYDTSTPSSS